MKSMKETFGSTTNFIVICIVIGGLVTQLFFTVIVPPTNWMLWQLMIVVFSTNLCAVIISVYGYRVFEKKQLAFEKNPRFFQTIEYISMFSEVLEEHLGTGEEAREEMKDTVNLVLKVSSKYFRGKKAARRKESLINLASKSSERVYEIVEDLT